MNAITNALNELKIQIPFEVLNIGFMEPYQELNNNISLDEMIISKVIRPRVLTDCNLVGGIQIIIPVDGCSLRYLNNTETLVKVPKTLTNNKSIISVLSLVSNGAVKPSRQYNSGISPALDIGSKMFNGMDNLNIIQTSRLELIAENTFIVAEYNLPVLSGAFRAIVENDSNLANINPRAYPAFSKLVLLAVKTYIYTNTVVRLDKGYIYGGHELSVIKDIIDGYADSYEMYKEHLEEKWAKIQFLNDDERTDRYIKNMLSYIS